ncbi:MAG: bifunctional diaminohydroxyphosphoribosylaminopyrimidine deaminase/5-amino-6-(5-phosphoribosylamino)uracil reductase RibD [Pseudomonadota bacterium]
MARALALAERGRFTCHPNPAVGCVLVGDNEVVGEGFHERAGEGHAEVNALAEAGPRARGATAFVTLEPCAHQGRTGPCAVALAEAGIVRVVAATEDPDPRVAGEGFARLRAAGIEVIEGVLATEARALNPGFFSRLERGRPWVRVKLAASLDGATAMADGASQWITGAAARRDGHRWRARAAAVMTGIGTVLSDDPGLNPRLPRVDRSDVCVVLDSQWRMPATAALLKANQRVLWVGDQHAARPFWADPLDEVQVEEIPAQGGRLQLPQVLEVLQREQLGEIHVEAGATLAGALLSANLVDELLVYLAPLLLGRATRGLVDLPLIRSMDDRINLKLNEVRQVGDDLRLRLTPEVI